jgi:hypothetical protein
MRAMTFEALVHHERFVSELLTKTVGQLGLERPDAVRRVDGKRSTAATASILEEAHRRAAEQNETTMLVSLAVPYVGLEDEDATAVLPDFAIVARRTPGDGAEHGSWLIMGDAKDFERVRSKIDDQRMLKGFLQVALGAESAAAWSKLPIGMRVHRSGALAVPRNAFLQPQAVVEELDDHRREVRSRVQERTELMAELGTTPVPDGKLAGFVADQVATFDPGSCASCAMFNYCRTEVRQFGVRAAVLIELGIRPELRPALTELAEGIGEAVSAPDSVVANVRATLTGKAIWTGQRRVDSAAQPGTINVVLAKSDSAALGVYGLGLQRIVSDGTATDWQLATFENPQSPDTRLAVMDQIGVAIETAMQDLATIHAQDPEPVHLVVPDAVTGDVLASIADSLAGVELSRLRWERDLAMGRPALTWDGEAATVPTELGPHQRLAVSFLLEEDRARAMSLRWPLVNVRTILGRHLVAGGPSIDHGRLDYLVAWAEADKALDHREVSDAIAASDHTPGARLSNARSDAVHTTAPRFGKRLSPGDPTTYRALIVEELEYKADVLERALAVLGRQPASRLQPVYRALESASQNVWRRRLELHASDLIRFGLTSWFWRNIHVPMLDADRKCADQLLALGNPQMAREIAKDAGNRVFALAEVVAVDPIRLQVRSRRLVDGTSVAAIHVNGEPVIEHPSVDLKIQATNFAFSHMPGGELVADEVTSRGGGLRWDVALHDDLEIGDELVVADRAALGGYKALDKISVARPSLDTSSAPKKDCDEASYDADPEGHQWCCRPHEAGEAAYSDELALRRERGELNPQVWPPVIDVEEFDTPAAASPTDAAGVDVDVPPQPGNLTPDDLD